MDLSITDIDSALAHARQRLADISSSPALDAELLLSSVLDKPRSWLYTWGDTPLDSSIRESFEALIARRSQGEPIAYLLGYRDFYGLRLNVGTFTLIPRADSECLVDKALELGAQKSGAALDLGSGTGAIALAFASHRPEWEVSATDLIPEAVSLIRENAQKHALTNVTAFESDWFSASQLANRQFDLIFSNPPYIEANDHHLSEGDVRFEPLSALVSEEGGYKDLEQIIRDAQNYLSEEGWLILEHGFQQASNVRAILEQYGYRMVDSMKDLGGNERISFGQKAVTAH